MKSSKKLQILKLEGFPSNKPLTCQVFQNSRPLKSFTITSSSELHEIDYQSVGQLEVRISVLSSQIHSLSSISSKSSSQVIHIPSSPCFSATICPNQIKPQESWLGLRLLSSSSSQSEDFPLQKVLIRGRWSPEENNESDDFQENYESFASELVLASMIESPSIDSEELLGRSDLPGKCKKQSMIIKVLTKQLEISNEKNLQLIKKVEMTEEKLSKSCEQLSSYIENSNEREKAFISTIAGKDSEFHVSLNSNLTLQAKVRSLENEKEHLNDQVHRLELEVERLKDAEKELLLANKKLQKSEMIQDQLNKTILRLSKSINDDPESMSNNQLAIKDAEIQMLKNISEEVKKSADMQIFSLNQEINELRSSLNSYQEQEKFLANKLKNCESDKSSQSFDAIFAESMQRLKLSFKKINDFTFEVNGKPVNAAFCRTGVFAKVGSSLLSLDEFFEEFLMKKSPRLERFERQEIEKFEKNEKFEKFDRPDVCYTVMTDRTNENFERRVQRISSQKTFLKGTQSSLNKSKGPTGTPGRSRFKSIERRPFR
jgi:hypothetical protein